jgi:hypothetical protein
MDAIQPKKKSIIDDIIGWVTGNHDAKNGGTEYDENHKKNEQAGDESDTIGGKQFHDPSESSSLPTRKPSIVVAMSVDNNKHDEPDADNAGGPSDNDEDNIPYQNSGMPKRIVSKSPAYRRPTAG